MRRSDEMTHKEARELLRSTTLTVETLEHICNRIDAVEQQTKWESGRRLGYEEDTFVRLASMALLEGLASEIG